MWNKLNMKQKAALIKMGVENNIYDIDEIKNIYNEYAKGGEVEKEKPLIEFNKEIHEKIPPNVAVIENRSYAKGGKVKKQKQIDPKAVYALNYFMNKGLSKEQAAGLVGNFMRESSMNITALNPYSGAYGLGQWLGGRKKKLFSMYGNNPTLQNQLDFTWHELNSSHGKGLRMLKQSKTVDEAAANTFGYYEFSSGPQAAVKAMNDAGMNTKWKNPNGTLALNSGIEKARLLLGINPTTVTSNPTQNYNFEATVAPALQPVQMKPIEIPDLKFSDASSLAEEKKEDNNDEQLLEQQLQKEVEEEKKNQLFSVFNFLNQKPKTQKNTPTNNYTIHI